MEPRLSTFKEFNQCNEAEDAVRALSEAGFQYIETEDLCQSLQSVSDVGTAPAKKVSFYVWTGVIAGIIGGFILGLTIFGVPSSLIEMPHADVVTIFGALLCTFVGAIVGLEEGFKFAGRSSPEPTSSD